MLLTLVALSFALGKKAMLSFVSIYATSG